LARQVQLRADLGHSLLDLGEDGVVAAPGAPADRLVRSEVLARVRPRDRDGARLRVRAHAVASRRRSGESISRIFSSISLVRNGCPCTLLKPMTSTRKFARSSMRS